MQNDSLDCRQGRDQIAAGEEGPELAAHVAACETCFDACLDAALRRPPEAFVPPGFAARTLARAPETRPVRAGLFPWALAAAGLLFAILGAMLYSTGWFQPLIGRPALYVAVASFETGFSLLWLWRTVTE